MHPFGGVLLRNLFGRLALVFQRSTNNTRVTSAVAALAMSTLLFACGGGDNERDGDEMSTTSESAETGNASTNTSTASTSSGVTGTTTYTGTYDLSATTTQDSCDSGAKSSLSASAVVKQSGSKVTVTSDGNTYTGQVSGSGTQFDATYDTVTDGVPVSSTIVVTQGSSANTYQFSLTVSATTSVQTCTIGYQGTASRRT